MLRAVPRSIVALAIFAATALLPVPAMAESAEEAIEAVVRGLERDWNAADMDAYLAAYVRDDSLRLVFLGLSLKGWDSVNEVFRDEYPDEERMGQFTIGELEVKLLGDEVGVANGTFEHVFPQQTVRGAFSHVLKRHGDGRWLIHHEHVSRGEVIKHEGRGG